MVKKLKNSRLFRISFSLISCLLVLVCCAAPAFAYGVDFQNGSSLGALIGGTLEISFYANDVPPSLSAGQYRVSVGIPQNYPFVSTNNTFYDMAEYVEYWNKSLATNPSKVQDYTLDIEMGRWRTSIGGKDAWFARTYFTSYSNFDSDEYAYFDKARFILDSFAMPFTEDNLKKVFAINVRNPMSINVSCSLRWVDSNGALVSTVYSYRPRFTSAPYRNVSAFFDDGVLQSFENFCSANRITPGQPVLFTDFEIDIDGTINGSFGTMHELMFQTITIKDKGLIPGGWWNTGNNPGWFFDQIKDDLISGTPLPPSDQPDVDTGSFFTSWLANTISGFFDFELLPGFSFGSVFSAILAVVIGIVIIKFFAGG